MGKALNKITWVIKNFSSLQSEKICSNQFVVGGCNWFLSVYPKGHVVDFLALYLEVANFESLPSGWRRHAKFSLTVVNQLSEKLSRQCELQQWFEQKATGWGRPSTFSLNEIHAKDSGFLLNGELRIVAEIEVLEVIGKLDVTEDSSIIVETINFNGFQLLPSQEKSVSRLFEKHPEIATEVRPKNPNLKTGYMSLLLSLIETMCQLPKEMSKDDLFDAYDVLGFMKDAGFKLDWLEKKLDEVSEQKENEEACESGLKEMEEELKELKQRYSDIEGLMEKEKVKVLAPKAPLSFDDVV